MLASAAGTGYDVAMGVTDPATMSDVFARLFNERDLRGLVALYASDATLTIDGVVTATGAAEIEAMIASLVDSGLTLNAHCASCHRVGDIALVRTDWTLTTPDGVVTMAGSSAEVLKHFEDDTWRFVVDDATFASRPPSL